MAGSVIPCTGLNPSWKFTWQGIEPIPSVASSVMSRTPRCRHHHRLPRHRHRPLSAGTAPSASHWLTVCALHAPLPPERVLELSHRIQRSQHQPGGSLSHGAGQSPCQLRRRALLARNQLACHNLRLIAHTWRRHRSVLPLEAEATADALQEAAIGLLRAAELFDPARGYRFSTYATYWVRRGFSEHQRSQRRLIRLPSHWIELLDRIERLKARYHSEKGEAASLEWLAERCRWCGAPLPVEKLRALLLAAQQLLPEELDRPVRGTSEAASEAGREATLLDRVPGREGADPTLSAATALEVADCAELTDFPNAEAQLADCAGDGHDEQRSMLPQLLRTLDPQERRL
jgi:RNA polymerase sigma factor (sigma-70 family)